MSNEPGSFRLRLRGGEASQEFGSSDGNSSDDDVYTQPTRRRQTTRPSRNGRPASGFQPGAIVRVKVRNFVTYEEAEFFLGPNLNMVIGPNGTGKSSLVCAICLGLGYSSNVLGRASQFGEFVKHGKEEAEIEIELQRKPEDPENYVVGLCIRREDNSRKFTLNGQRVAHRDIQKLMQSLRIQIDNLCQFLPQDKVAEFAALTPVELLDKTLQAAAPEEMIEQRAELKELFKAQKESQRSSEKTREELRKLESRQQVLQADVEKLRERRAIQEEIEDLKKVRVVVEYNEARAKYNQAKEHRIETQRALKRLERDSAPALEAVNKKQEYATKIELVVSDRQRRLREAEEAADAAAQEVDAAGANCQRIHVKKEEERRSIQERKHKIGTAKKKISKLEADYRKAPPPFDSQDWNRRIREKQHIEREKKNEVYRVGGELDELRSTIIDLAQRKKELKATLDRLASKEGQMLSHLERLDRDVAEGWKWLKDHQNEFEKEVFGPPMLTCSVKDMRYSDMIQAMLQRGDFLCFTSQTKEDHKKLSDQFYRKMGLSVTIRTTFSTLDSFRPPLPRDELRRLGFDGYVTDYLEGPEPVLAMLCGERKLHASVVALQDISDEQYELILQNERLNQFAAHRKMYRIVRRREYGPGAVSTRVNQINRGRFWTEEPADAAEKEEIERQIDDVNTQGRKLQEEQEAKKKLHEKLETERVELNKMIDDMQRQKNELQAAYTKWQELPNEIERAKKELEFARTAYQEAKTRTLELEQEHDQAVLDKAKAILKHHEQLNRIREARQALLEAQLVLLEAKSDVAVLNAKNIDITQKIQQAKDELKAVEDELKMRKDMAKSAQAAAAALLTVENKEEMAAKSAGKTVADIDDALQLARTKLEVIQANNPQALEEYERYAERIRAARTQQERQDGTLAELNARIDEIKSQWEPRLDALVGEINDAFSYNFEQISCAGEVAVHKDEDFDRWAIEIRVKFRENETLQRLDQHRQSGGERAVSTIFYLMALQSMAQAPFRVVDEINQGMDPRNERMVHERMVEVACREHTSQYFLITPKLLSGLRYDERMRVHTIVSGENVDPRGTEKMDFRKFARIQRSLVGR